MPNKIPQNCNSGLCEIRTIRMVQLQKVCLCQQKLIDDWMLPFLAGNNFFPIYQTDDR